MATTAGAPLRGGQRVYLRVSVKFAIASVAALCWLLFSVIVSRPWMASLGEATHPLFALFAITFIAYVPGFMNMFLVVSLLLDRRPKRRQPPSYPGVTILIAAYQEEAAIADTLKTIAAEDYSGPLEVLVLNDGSTDRTGDVAKQAIHDLIFLPNMDVRHRLPE